VNRDAETSGGGRSGRGGETWPAYVRLYESGELSERVAPALEKLADCTLCPRNCHVNRLADETAVCHIGRHPIVSSSFPHHGEECCLRGRRGSGTIFFCGCNLRCVFCQNFDISWECDGQRTRPEELAAMMLHLQARGCHNINFVTPEHVVPQILEALLPAVESGLRLPLVYNTGAYDSLDSLRLLDGVVDIYMPDFKFWDPGMARRYAKAPDYPEVARRAILEMHRQVGPLVLDENGLARRGVLVRHLLMPGSVAGTPDILAWLARELGPDAYVNIMTQYHPAGRVSGEDQVRDGDRPNGERPATAKRYPEIARRITDEEFVAALAAARAAGLRRLDS